MDHTLTQMPVLNKEATPRKLEVSDNTKTKRVIDRYLLLVFGLDCILMNLCLIGSMNIQFLYEKVSSQPVLVLCANFIWALIFVYSDLYQNFEGLKLNLKIKDLLKSTLIFLGAITILSSPYLFPDFQLQFLLPTSLAFLVLSIVSHLVVRYALRNRKEELYYAVIGGGSKNINNWEKEFFSMYGQQTNCVGRFASENIPGVTTLGSYEEIEDFLKENNRINKLLYFYSNLSKQTIKRIIQLCRTKYIEFEIIPVGVDFFERGIQLDRLARVPILRRKNEPLCQLRNKILKRTFDIVFSLAVILLVFSWLYPLVRYFIKRESKGPTFFNQMRTGYWNKPFDCFKFRTMQVNENSDQLQATKGDSRITKIGAFLRKTNIDELPQFFNVLKGEMSIVGPRPHMVKHTEDYSALIDKYMIRHEVKPGITGWAQVNGWRGPTEEVYQMEKRVEYDVFYIENWSFWFDCKCIFLTIFNTIKGEENAF
ncbi:exopolysaccharide biosynthesis polyprenyl glycosylphosphotransferase [Haliscomenobacter sp.]|uniref:exopolysaccharide biosynthesis polyprenyl glycosylphosphotransferase n=1 Tax=Haliscomenobacter sp. TaxID=2717303 RepID=UPI003364D1D3